MNEEQTTSTEITATTDKTTMPLGLVVACVMAILAATLWINNSLNRIENRIAAIEGTVSDRWTANDMKVWIVRLRIENPQIKVPSTTFE